MKYDLFSYYWDEEENNPFINEILEIEDFYCRIKLFTLSSINPSIKVGILEKYKEKMMNFHIPQENSNLMRSLGIDFDNLTIDTLPLESSVIQINFFLKKPYISRDDEEFYIHENPVSKEKVFKIPYIRPSSWKGMMRWVALIDLLKNMKEKKNWNDAFIGRSQIIRIFGNEKENREDRIFKELFPENLLNTEDNKFNHEFLKYIIKKNYVNKDGLGKGRLYFYPTFFDRISLDIINPHDRETRTGTNPITIEIVPEDTKGCFKLLYFPFDIIGEDKKIVKKEMKEDLLIVCNALKLLFKEYGISAKRTSGYGAAEITKVTFESKGFPELEQIENIDTLINKLRKQSVGIQ